MVPFKKREIALLESVKVQRIVQSQQKKVLLKISDKKQPVASYE